MLAFYPLGLQATVTDLAGASTFVQDVLQMPIRGRGDTWVEFDNSSLVLRLVRGTENTPTSLVLMADELRAAADALLLQPGVSPGRQEIWATPARRELSVVYAGWLELVLARNYNEDELGIAPDLPTELAWDRHANELLLSLLARVPVIYRAGARAKATRHAEALTLEKGEVEVAPFEAVRGLVQATPIFQHKSLWFAIREVGQEPERWEPELVKELKL